MSVLERVHAAQSNNTSDSREGGLGQNSQLPQQRSDLKKKLVSQLGLSTISQLMKQGDIGYVREELTVACQEILNENSFDVPELETSAHLIRQVVDEICGLGPIQPLLEDLEVTEIMINGCGSLFTRRTVRSVKLMQSLILQSRFLLLWIVFWRRLADASTK